MRLSGYKPYMANILQELHPNDYVARVVYAESMMKKIKNLPELIKVLQSSDEAIFQSNGVIKKLKYSY